MSQCPEQRRRFAIEAAASQLSAGMIDPVGGPRKAARLLPPPPVTMRGNEKAARRPVLDTLGRTELKG